MAKINKKVLTKMNESAEKSAKAKAQVAPVEAPVEAPKTTTGPKLVELKIPGSKEPFVIVKPTTKKRPWTRLVSPTNPELWIRVFIDLIEKHGVPLDPNGERMVPGKIGRGRAPMNEAERLARQAEKEAEKAKFAAMSDEEKLEFAKMKREQAAAKRAAKKAEERAALIAELKAQIAAGEI